MNRQPFGLCNPSSRSSTTPFAKRRKTEEEEAQTDEEVFLSTAFNNKLLFEHTLCRPVAVCPLSRGKRLKKKHQDKPEVPQGEPRTGPKQDQLTVAQCNEQFEKRYACGEIYI